MDELLLRTYAWMGLLSVNGPVNAILALRPGTLYYAEHLRRCGAGHGVQLCAYMILPLYTSMTKMTRAWWKLREDAGRFHHQTLLRVLIPMSVPGISTGITMVFVPAVFHLCYQPYAGRRLQPAHWRSDRDAVPRQQLQPQCRLCMSLVLMVIVLLCMSFTSSFDEDEMEGVS